MAQRLRYERDGAIRHCEPLWRPDYANDDEQIELSFRDSIELRFVKAFRDLGLSLPAIRECFQRAVIEVQDQRPFSTQRFRTDGKTIFLEITEKTEEGNLIDLRRRQSVLRTIAKPSLRDLEFDAEVVARWFPLGQNRRSIIIDPARAFGRPVVSSGVPTEVLSDAVLVEGSVEKVV
jgi:DNA-binding transcriptional MerR regulator